MPAGMCGSRRRKRWPASERPQPSPPGVSPWRASSPRPATTAAATRCACGRRPQRPWARSATRANRTRPRSAWSWPAAATAAAPGGRPPASPLRARPRRTRWARSGRPGPQRARRWSPHCAATPPRRCDIAQLGPSANSAASLAATRPRAWLKAYCRHCETRMPTCARPPSAPSAPSAHRLPGTRPSSQSCSRTRPRTCGRLPRGRWGPSRPRQHRCRRRRRLAWRQPQPMEASTPRPSPGSSVQTPRPLPAPLRRRHSVPAALPQRPSALLPLRWRRIWRRHWATLTRTCAWRRSSRLESWATPLASMRGLSRS
mmetsp:Transcript_95874/g.243708  ORF Transcript_95874/g.243708 Transcript_95874/m.243708 type:complete len:315 (+) Transcript_95874:301-1245(+)